MRPKRVLLVRNAAPQDFGGAERYPVFLANELESVGLKVFILSSHEGLLAFSRSQKIDCLKGLWLKQQNWTGWRTVLLPFFGLWLIVLFLYYICIILHLKIDVLHLQSRDDFIAGSIAGRLLGKRVIWTDHADLKHIWNNLLVWYKNPVGRLTYMSSRFVHRITVVSQSELGLIINNLPKRSRVISKFRVVYNGSKDTLNNYPSKPNPLFTFCMAGRMVTDKGVGEAIRAFSIIHRKHKDSRLILIGEGPERLKFQKIAGGLPVEFTGHLADPLAVMSQASVYLHPTYHEGFSMSLVEAAMLGLPIIATNVGGNPEIIQDKSTGLLVPAKNVEALADSMLRLVNNPSVRKRIGKQARREFVARFNFSTIVKKEILPLYES